MKLTTLVLLAAFLQVSAATFAQKVTLAQKRATLAQIFTAIHEQTGYNVLWSGSELRGLSTQDVNFKDTPFRAVLDEVLKDQPLTYEVQDQTILIKKKQVSVSEKPVSPPANAPPVTVTGKVVDELGNPMVGVTVKQKDNPTNATGTNAKGNYILSVPDDKTILVFSFVGYDAQEFAAKDLVLGSIITLKANETRLQEVVINKGYYREKRALSTGDVSAVTSKELEEQPLADPILMLEGKVPGLYISQISGVPGANSTVRVMGQNSIQGGNNPLYIVDGNSFSNIAPSSPFFGGAYGEGSADGRRAGGASPFNMLDPSDIESIEVLKDADATAIYGSRGANGVILITTKKGKAGDTRVSFNISQGNGQVTRMMPLMNTQQYVQMRKQAFQNDGVTPSFGNGDYDLVTWDTTRTTDWQKFLVGNTAHYTKANFTISGGNSNTQFLLGGTFNRQTAVYRGNYADNKSSGFININHHSSNQRFVMQLNVGYTYDYNNEPVADMMSTALTLAPDVPALFNADGSRNYGIYNGTYTTLFDPFNYEAETFWLKTNNLTSSLNLSYQLLPGLKLQTNFGYNNEVSNQTNLIPLSFFPPIITDPSNRQNITGTDQLNSWSIEPQLSYERSVGRGQLNALVGTSFQNQSVNDFAVGASGFNTDAAITNPVVASSINLSNQQLIYRYNAVYGRIGYTWGDKYLLNITGRRDGSSKFGPSRQWGNFGALGTGWIFSKEKFITDRFSWLSFGKLRASYGITGNDQIGDYQYLSTYTGATATYLGQNVYGPTALTNPYLSWEHVKKVQLGADVGFLKDRINVTATWYRNRDDDQLIAYALPATTGFTTIQENLPARVENSGWEFTFNSQNIVGTRFKWTSAFNLTLPQNKLLAFPNIQNTGYATSWAVGHSLFSKFVYNYLGVSSQTGNYTFSTQNANGLPSPGDRVLSQPVTQSAYGAFSNSFQYGGFQLSVMLQFVKQLGYNYLQYSPTPGTVNNNEPVYFLNAWPALGSQSNVARYTQNGARNAFTAYSDLTQSTAAISDASFIRLRNISLGYSIPQAVIRKLELQSARIYLNAENLLTITGYKGIDPETQGQNLPPIRMIALGLQGTF